MKRTKNYTPLRGFAQHVRRVLAGLEAPDLGAYSFSALKIGPQRCDEVGGRQVNWRVQCPKCKGTGNFIDQSWAIQNAFSRREDKRCFMCQGQGAFPLPSPEQYALYRVLGFIYRMETVFFKGAVGWLKRELNWLHSAQCDGPWISAVAKNISLGAWEEKFLEVYQENPDFVWKLEHDMPVWATSLSDVQFEEICSILDSFYKRNKVVPPMRDRWVENVSSPRDWDRNLLRFLMAAGLKWAEEALEEKV